MKGRVERNNVTANIWTARAIPVILAGIVGYATSVLVYQLSVKYLIVEYQDYGAAIIILIIYFLLFIFMASSFFRLVYITTFDPPYVPLGPTFNRHVEPNKTKARPGSEEDGLGGAEYEMGDTFADTVLGSKNDPDCPGLELFYTKDVFVCEMDGRPQWCSQCKNWKPDRAHHCSTSGRCIRKMDHFCPWVGGPVGENNFKFFTQFVGYTSLYCLHLLVAMVVYIHQQLSTQGEKVNAQFVVILVIAALFFMFTAGMTGTSFHLILFNRTQVENLNARTKIHVLAVRKPSPGELLHIDPKLASQSSYLEITYPLEANGPPNIHSPVNASLLPSMGSSTEQTGLPTTPNASSRTATATSEHLGSPASTLVNSSAVDPVPTIGIEIPTTGARAGNIPPRNYLSERDRKAKVTFAILRTPVQGQNPWDLKSFLLNWQTVMGTNIFDYFLPIRRSPCCDHDDPESQFAIGPCVDQLRIDYGLISPDDSRVRSRRNVSSHGNEKGS